MLCIFTILIISIIVLLAYFSYRSKTISQIENLYNELKKVSDDKDLLESNYNKLISDIKKQEELKKGKDLDEMQLLFTKVNMLDEKLTFLNTNFKSKLDSIATLLEDCLTEVKKAPVSNSQEQIEDNFDKFEEKNDNLFNTENTDIVENENISIDDFLNNNDMNFNNNMNEVENKETGVPTEDIKTSNEFENNPSDWNLSNPNEDTESVAVNNDNSIENELNSADTIYSNEHKVDNNVEQNTANINEQPQSFDSDNVLDSKILNEDESEYKPENNEIKIENVEEDDELNSALKDLNNINFNISDSSVNLNKDLNSEDFDNVDNIDLENDLNINSFDNDNVTTTISPQNFDEKHDGNLTTNIEPIVDTNALNYASENTNSSYDNHLTRNSFNENNEEFDKNDKGFGRVINGLSGNDTIKVNEKMETNNESGFDIKDSIEKLKAQLDTTNKEEENN